MAAKLGIDRVELYTEPYAASYGTEHGQAELQRYSAAAEAAHLLGLGVNAGHDLSLRNLGTFLESVPNVLEVSIGHALVSHAFEVGLGQAVREYADLIGQAVGGVRA